MLSTLLVVHFIVLSHRCASASASASVRPNIVLFVTDDQDSVLGGMTPMKMTEKLISKNGITFAESFAAAPICCPSRSSVLTGMYPHNHGTVNNTVKGGCSSESWQKNHEPYSFAAVLQKEAKYATFYAGKYLNEYGSKEANGPEHVPVGWGTWRGLVGNSKYYNFTLSRNGIPKNYNNGEYLTDVIRDETVAFIDKQHTNKFAYPMLIVAAPPAPHAPFEPAPRHSSKFPSVRAPRTPNFNIPAKDKHWLLTMPPAPLPDSLLPKLDSIYRRRWQTLLAVDEMVEAVIGRLEMYDVLKNTYVIFTSDNGYHIGQFSQPFDKRQPYDTDVKVPLTIRGPGIEKGVRSTHPVVNVDLAPTILKMAGVAVPDRMDGVPLPVFESELDSLEPSIETNELLSSESYDRLILIEYRGENSSEKSVDCPNSGDLYGCLSEYACKCQDSRNNSYSCVRHLHPVIDFMYCAFDDSQGFEEAYDVKKDAYQMNNVISEILPAIKFKYRDTLARLTKCKGSECNSYDLP